MDKSIKKELKLRRKNLKENRKRLYKGKNSILKKILVTSIILIIAIPSFFYISDVIELKARLDQKNGELKVIENELKEKTIELSEIKKDKNLEFSARENLRYVGEGEIFFEFES